MKRDLKMSWFLPYSPEQIWDCLTKPELVKQWWKVTDFKAEVGFEYEVHNPPRRAMNWDGIQYHKVLEVVPLKKLSYTFQGGPRKGELNLNTVVTWTLVAKGNGTELILDHTGFEGAKNVFVSFIMEMGWKKKVIKRFEKTLEPAKL